MELRKTKEELNVFMQNITLLRKKHNISKVEMAKLLEIGIGSLNKLEKGEMPPRLSVSILFAINRHFGIPPYSMFCRIFDKEDYK